MNRLELTGLRADVPLAAMAAFGCLRICDRIPEFRGSKLGFAENSGLDTAVLFTPREASRQEFVSALMEDVKQAAGRMELTWRDQIKTASREEFRIAAREALKTADLRNRETADWFAAFGTELELSRDGKIESTPFDMSVARQRFLADAVRLATSLAEGRDRGKTTADAYREALFGPWKYEDDQHSLGWDPSTMKLGAFTYKAPTSMANAGVRAAVWLAFESLPLFPCFYAGRLTVRSFQRERREFIYHWPVWRDPIGLDALQSLLAWLPDAKESELETRGVVASYQSTRFKPNKYMVSFRPSELTYRAAAGGAV